MIARAALAFALVAALGEAACAERLIVSVSNHRVSITPYYSGAELVLFGEIERDVETASNRGGYDVVVTVTGPRADMTTRRKERVTGVWINADSRRFQNVPGYLAISANRAFGAIAPPDVLRRHQVGLDNTLLTQRIGPDLADVVVDDPFRAAFVRLKGARGLYRESTNGVVFLSPTLFRAGIPLPGEVPVGAYDVDIKLFSSGVLLARAQTAFEIVKVGFEQFVAEAARDNSLAYGLAATMMTLVTGWLASIVFRRD